MSSPYDHGNLYRLRFGAAPPADTDGVLWVDTTTDPPTLRSYHIAGAVWAATSGVAGPQGPQGPQGPIGLTGPAGIDGDNGAAGATGPTGVASATPPLLLDPTTKELSIPAATAGNDGYMTDDQAAILNYLDLAGMTFLSAYESGSAYHSGDVVPYGGSTWVAEGTTLQAPGGTDWTRLGYNAVDAVANSVTRLRYNNGAEIALAAGLNKLNFSEVESAGVGGWGVGGAGRFTPSFAGNYQIACTARIQGTITGGAYLIIYRNGVAYKRGLDHTSGTFIQHLDVSVYLNGTTDYIELYIFVTGSAMTLGCFLQVTYADITLLGGQQGEQGIPGVNGAPATALVAGTMSAADFTKLLALGNVLLDYTAATDLVNGSTVGTGWASTNMTQTVNIPAATSKLLVFVSGNVAVSNNASGAAQNCASRLAVDGLQYAMLGGDWLDIGKVANALAGAGATIVTGLSAGNHTFNVEIYASANCLYYLRAASQAHEKLRMVIIEIGR